MKRPAIRRLSHSSNGLGLSCEEAFEEIQEYKQVFKLLGDRPEIFPTWERLNRRYQVMGKQLTIPG